MSKQDRTARKFSRKGLHRLECPMCSCYGYFTVAMLENAGELPACFARGCGETMQPTELELAMILEAEDSRPMMSYVRECNSVAKGQAPHGMRGHELKRTPEEVAAERVESDRRSSAALRRRSALRPVTVEAMPF
jgi:hypothetical protein